MWYGFLKAYPVQFRRQVPFGPYFVDFFCHKANLVIELDGSHHYEENGLEYDQFRTDYLEQEQGFSVLRFSNLDVLKNYEGVCTAIDLAVKEKICPSFITAKAVPPSPKGRLSMKTVTIYTDGACSGNPGPGGWGAILEYGGIEKELSGGAPDTTNNRMELLGVITALEALKEPCVVELYSDSKYVIDALDKGWAVSWRARGWKRADKKPALNPDLWARLLDLCETHTVHCHWVKGHADNPKNNRCDELAVTESQKYK